MVRLERRKDEMNHSLQSIKTIVFYNLSSGANESRTEAGVRNEGEMAVLRSQSQKIKLDVFIEIYIPVNKSILQQRAVS